MTVTPRISFIVLLLFLAACRDPGDGALIAGLRGYETVQDVREQLIHRCPNQKFEQAQEPRDPTDRRPPHDILYLTGECQHLGHTGLLRLTFYNNRLMTAEFWPKDETGYVEALRRQGIPAPSSPSIEVEVGRRTRFSYYTDPRGRTRFVWEDIALSKEFSDWVAKYS